MTMSAYTKNFFMTLTLAQALSVGHTHAEDNSPLEEGQVVSCLTVGQDPNIDQLRVCGDTEISVGESFEHRTQRRVHRGESFEYQSVAGPAHFEGSVDFASYPVSMSGSGVMEIDQDQGGVTALEAGDLGLSDVVLAGEGAVRLTYQRVGLDLDLNLGQGSVMYDGAQGELGELSINARRHEQIFEGSLLEEITHTRVMKTVGHWRSDDDFSVHMSTSRGRVQGFPLSNINVTLSPESVAVIGRLKDLELFNTAEAWVAGDVEADEELTLTGEADLNLAGFTIPHSELTLTHEGLSAQGELDLTTLGQVGVSGQINANGNASLSGNTTLNVAGMELGDAQISINRNRVMVDGQLDLGSLGSAQVRGRVNSDGSYLLRGNTRLEVGSLRLYQGRVEATPNQIEVSGSLRTSHRSVELRGTLNAQGVSMSGSSQIEIPLKANLSELQYVVDGAICGYEIATDAAECGYRVVTSAAECGVQYVKDGAMCGYRTVTSAAECGSEVITDGAQCGFESFVDLACKAVCGIFGCSCNSTRPKSCEVPKSCQVAKRCQIAKSCEVVDTCEIELGCETQVEVPDVDLGVFTGEISVNVNSASGASANISGRYCSPERDCFEISSQGVMMRDGFKTCFDLTVLDAPLCVEI